jgi:hypothetical protein
MFLVIKPITCKYKIYIYNAYVYIYPPPSRAEVNERVELYLYSPSGPSWPVLG